MNIQQIEYIVALAELAHFGKAAERCHVSQPGLSSMVAKLEQELGIVIFDRSQSPIALTREGIPVVEQARKILSEWHELSQIGKVYKKDISGVLRLGVIPTIAPYLIPKWSFQFGQAFPKVTLQISEMMTSHVISQIDAGQIDAGLVAFPYPGLEHYESRGLFEEELWLYTSHQVLSYQINGSDLNKEELWLLEEGHCLRHNVLDFCQIHKAMSPNPKIRYEAGSLNSLIEMVDTWGGVTLLPDMAVKNLTEDQMEKLRHFAEPVPKRQVAMIWRKRGNVSRLVEALLSVKP